MIAEGQQPSPKYIGHLIGAQMAVGADDSATFETWDPHDGSLLATVARGSTLNGERAIEAARQAFDQGPWPRMTPKERHRVLHTLADLVDNQRDALAMLETKDSGKAINQTVHADIPRVAQNLRFFADYAALVSDEAYPDGSLLSYTVHPPAGVVAAISPWNAPLMLASWKIAPALAFGNTVVLKPAPQTPLTANWFGQLALEAGLPPGVLNIVHGFGSDEVGARLTTDPRVDRITFTGSSTTGAQVMRAAAGNLIPVSAELGGKSANIVFNDANLDVAIPESIRGIFAGNGQVCLSGSRLFVERGIYAEFLDRFTAEAKKLTVGDPKDHSTYLGPLIEQEHLDKVHRYVELAQNGGGTVVTGGSQLVNGEYANGFYYPPTIITGMDNSSQISQEEIFGPVEIVIPFDSEDEVLAMANDSQYGLAGILFTTNLDRAHRMAARWKAGTIWVNCFFERDLRLPFGGERTSGVGREGGRYSRDFFTEPRAVTLRIH
ncbi:aldehyde dehydrogenase [Lipingzhangella sp. LS1_29]|uniref:Aldehyde dehydrogenase n=1 Tax=Lipingzhangella rawalii TaxID=2055835 RepID=A0ABU2HBC0_9ACTN|nr:aldehyde dehydrogenase [Lipingzhangella rawalii]MDS1272593.1 aldehyde dehydrogenase [Lipingzhangella rawalii]